VPDIELVKRLVVQAGKAALAHWGTIKPALKSDQSYVTEVDYATERFLEEELSAAYPGFGFIGEEFGRRGPENAPMWACDPIDGTTNFVVGLPHWGVSVGLLHEDRSLLGAIYLPVLDELFWGVRGQGAFCNGIPVHASDANSLHPEDTLCMTSNAIKTLNTEAIVGRIRALGSIATELAYTARGNFRATIGLKEGIVDIAAALCICQEAGCEFRYLRGPLVDIQALLRQRRTEEHFVYGPPMTVRYLQSILHRR